MRPLEQTSSNWQTTQTLSSPVATDKTTVQISSEPDLQYLEDRKNVNITDQSQLVTA